MDTSDPDLRIEFDNEPGAPKKARDALAAMLDPHDPMTERVRLVASEMVTNVILHTAQGGAVQAWGARPDRPFRLEVEDHDRTLPSPRPTVDIAGRGLRIVEAIADSWGAEPIPTGKVVWAEFGAFDAHGAR